MIYRKGFLIVFWGSSIGGGGVFDFILYIFIYKYGFFFDGLEYYDSYLLIK